MKNNADRLLRETKKEQRALERAYITLYGTRRRFDHAVIVATEAAQESTDGSHLIVEATDEIPLEEDLPTDRRQRHSNR